MVTFLILAVSIVLVGALLKRDFVSKPSARMGETAVESEVAQLRRMSPLRERVRSIALVGAPAVIGWIVALSVGPLVVALVFVIAGSAIYYRTPTGKVLVDRVLGRARQSLVKTAGEFESGVRESVKSLATQGSKDAGPGGDLPSKSIADLCTQFASSLRIGRATGDQATIDQARKVASHAIDALIDRLTRQGAETQAALQRYLDIPAVDHDSGAREILSQVVVSADIARFDPAGYRALLIEKWEQARASSPPTSCVE